jgi:hypothetical protein
MAPHAGNQGSKNLDRTTQVNRQLGACRSARIISVGHYQKLSLNRSKKPPVTGLGLYAPRTNLSSHSFTHPSYVLLLYSAHPQSAFTAAVLA